MRFVGWIALPLVMILLIVLLVPRAQFPTHGHSQEQLEVRVRVVDSETGQPLGGALVVVARFRGLLHHDESDRDPSDTEEPSQAYEILVSDHVAATRTTEDPVTTVVTSAYVTRVWDGEGLSDKSVSLPEVLRIHHPKGGCTIAPIDPETPLAEGDEPNTWRLDLGTVRVP